MIKDNRGKTPRFILIGDPDNQSKGARLVLNQFTGETARCNLHDLVSMRRACRKLYERDAA